MIGNINPKEYPDIPLWCVYGADCFPSLFCCKIRKWDTPPVGCGFNIWGYSVWRRQPGFRTLGRDLDDWIEEKLYLARREPKFFLEQEQALEHLRKITTPKA